MSGFWQIYYPDKILSSTDFSPEEVEERGVQVIIQEDPDAGWVMIRMRDYYVWVDDRWLGVDINGLFDYLASPGWKRVLMGRTIKASEYDNIYQKAKKNKTLLQKQGFSQQEWKEGIKDGTS